MTKWYYPHTEILDQFRKAINKVEGLELKGKTTPYTSVNGHMTSFLDKDGNMGLRLSKEDLEKFLVDHKAERMEQYGRVMKDFAVVPKGVFNDPKKLINYLSLSYRSASALKPKATQK